MIRSYLRSALDTNTLAQGDDMTIQLPRVASTELMVFDASAEGHVSEVRWSAFQFLLSEIAEVRLTEVRIVHCACAMKDSQKNPLSVCLPACLQK